jgi:hypothetical protein
VHRRAIIQEDAHGVDDVATLVVGALRERVVAIHAHQVDVLLSLTLVFFVLQESQQIMDGLVSTQCEANKVAHDAGAPALAEHNTDLTEFGCIPVGSFYGGW